MFKKIKHIINRETILYGAFGVLTSIINIGLYQYLIFTGMLYNIANLIALVVTKVIAYILNKVFVFKSRTPKLGDLLKEFMRFIVTRGFTMLVDYIGLIILVEILKFDKLICKYVITILVVILNYFLGKKHVFIGKNEVITD